MIKRLLLPVLWLALSVGGARAAPALFVVQGGKSPLYLFGSLHAFQSDIGWYNATIERAFAEAQECWFESDIEAIGATDLLGAVSGLDLFRKLSRRLDTDDQALFKRKIDELLPGYDFLIEHMRPWLAALTILVSEVAVELTDTIPGADQQLLAAAHDAGKPIRGLEAMADIFPLMDTLSEKDQLMLLQAVLRAPRGDGSSLVDFQKAWLAGDLAEMEAAANDIASKNPILDRTLIQGRNRNWLASLESLLEQGPTAFVTVGALHLAGPGNVRALLEQAGYTVERIQ